MTGKFITLEGGEGSGKSTQLKLLCEAFSSKKIPYISTREPGGSPGGEQIRRLLVGGLTNWNAGTETLLFYAARLDHVNTLIKPALAENKIVLCDRFADSTIVYQGIGKGLDAEYIRSLHNLTLGNFMPDLTLILDIDPAIGLKRAQARGDTENRFEKLGLDFHNRIRAGFLTLAEREPQRCVVVDVNSEPNELHRKIIEIVNQKLNLSL